MRESSSHRLLTALAARDRLNASEEFLETVSGQEVLIVSASRMAADELARRFCLKTGGSLGLHRFSLGALAIEVASPRLSLSGKSVLDGIAVDALAARAVQECRSQSHLKWFVPVATAPGFFRALASTLTELRLNNIDVYVLGRAKPAGVDLALLISAYEQYLSDAGLADSAEIYRTAALVVSDGQHRFRGLPLLLLDLAPRSEVERDFISSLIKQAGPVYAVCGLRDEKSLSFFEQASNSKADERREPDSTALHQLREHVFSTSRSPARLENEIDSTVEFRSATDEARECVEIARSILFAAETGVPFDQMAVLLRNSEAYQPLLEDALRRAGIPGFFSR